MDMLREDLSNKDMLREVLSNYGYVEGGSEQLWTCLARSEGVILAHNSLIANQESAWQ
jgi:hypothetical protein